LKLERDFMVGYSPEREDPNNPDFTSGNIPKVVGSTSPEGLEVVQNLYDQIVSKTVPVPSVEVAEATKLMENIFRAVNIALVNELKIAFEKMGIDIWEVIEGSKTKPFGFMPFYPGPGLGGHCIPIDPFYLSWKAKQYGVNTRFIELAGEINRAMTDHVVMRVMEALSDQDKPLKGANIHILGLAYKPNVDDDRESPSYYLMEQLEQRGAIVTYHDPHIPVIRPSRSFAKFAGRKSTGLNGIHDLVLIVTAHDEYADIDFYGLNIPVVDTRNIVAGKFDLLYKA
ncbi:MAG: nucleotide sugar dehydrogenase, partial [Candidatus Marinimicrobia bacterium]|nr:nucleotide sugar dehydrogenase [Candidatus Neomarinimicrobiota bacterium]